jgi:hypothetical protein
MVYRRRRMARKTSDVQWRRQLARPGFDRDAEYIEEPWSPEFRKAWDEAWAKALAREEARRRDGED